MKPDCHAVIAAPWEEAPEPVSVPVTVLSTEPLSPVVSAGASVALSVPQAVNASAATEITAAARPKRRTFT